MKPKSNEDIRKGLKELADKFEGQTIEPYYTPWVKNNFTELFRESEIAKGNKVLDELNNLLTETCEKNLRIDHLNNK